MKKKKNRVIPAILLALMLLFITLLVADLVPILVQVVKDRGDESQMVRFIDAYGARGVLLLIGLEALQVIVAVIPAAAIQVLAGLCYGVWRGAGLCIVGSILGNVVVFVSLRQFGQVLGPLIAKNPRPKKQKKGRGKGFSLQRITRSKNPQRVAFWLYLIPGIPSGVLPYLFARTKISFIQYLTAVVAGSIPSVLLCTWLGERLSKGDFATAAILAAAVALLLAVLLLFRGKLLARMGLAKDEPAETPDEAANPPITP